MVMMMKSHQTEEY